MEVAVFRMNSEELEFVYEDMGIVLDQASQEMYVMHGPRDKNVRCSECKIIWQTCEAVAATLSWMMQTQLDSVTRCPIREPNSGFHSHNEVYSTIHIRPSQSMSRPRSIPE